MIAKITVFAVLCLALIGCTPKTPPQTTETKPTTNQPTPQIQDNPCPTFNKAPNPDKALEDFVLYRDYLKANDWQAAYEKWQAVYQVAPAADGKRTTVFTDGIKFYEHFMTKNPEKKKEYLQEIFRLYDEMEKCYPEGGLVTGLKAFDYFFKYPDELPKAEQYNLFKKSIEQDNGKPRYFVLNPFTALLVDLALEEKIPVAEAQKYQQIIRNAIAEGLAKCQGKDCENWKIINEYAPARLEALESIENFYPCDYYSQKYYQAFQAAPNDCETIVNTYSRLRWGKCSDTDPQVKALNDAYNKNCRRDEGPSCNDLLRDGRYRDAVKCLEDALPNISDAKGKAQYNLLIAKIYFAYLKNYSRSRQYAREAARLQPNWGEPWLLIGTLYASSGPLCGPGRGWDSQVVVWPAIDMWQKAKSLDPTVATEANKLIGQYAQYMPSVEEIFQRNLKEGSPYFVPCWIQETTTIRAAK